MSLGPDGAQYPIKHGEIRSGDLLEVSVQLDIEIAQGPLVLPRTSIFFSFNRVLRVIECDQLREREVSTFSISKSSIKRALTDSLVCTTTRMLTRTFAQSARCYLPRKRHDVDHRGPANIGWVGNHTSVGP